MDLQHGFGVLNSRFIRTCAGEWLERAQRSVWSNFPDRPPRSRKLWGTIVLKRLRFAALTQAFEVAVATRAIATMIDSYLDGHAGTRSVGCEQEPIENWDDVVQEESDGTFVHFQVKRQRTEFCSYLVNRKEKLVSRGKHKGQPGPQSKLDLAMTSLSAWLREGSGSSQPRRFVLLVPSLDVQIKTDLKISALQELCVACQGAASSPAALEKRATSDSATKRICTWLETWCSFNTLEEKFNGLRALSILNCSLEGQLHSDVDSLLSSKFTDASAVRKIIASLIQEESDPGAPFTPRMVLQFTTSLLRPDVRTWTQYQCCTSTGAWYVSGTHDLSPGSLEKPTAVVRALWRSASQQRSLRVDCLWTAETPNALHRALGRLALHLRVSAQALFSEVPGWMVGIEHAVGGTIGIAHTALGTKAWANYECPVRPIEKRQVNGVTAVDAEAESLHCEMDRVTWEQIASELSAMVANLPATTVRDAVEMRWQDWRAQLETDQAGRDRLLQELLCAKAEGSYIDSKLRVGVLSVPLLRDALFLLLVVAAAIGDSTANWFELSKGRDVRTIGLARRARSVSGSQEVIELDIHSAELLSKELASVVILAGVGASESEVLGNTIGHDDELANMFAAPRTQRKLITNATTLRNLLRVEDPERDPLQELREYLGADLAKREHLREEAITAIYPRKENG